LHKFLSLGKYFEVFVQILCTHARIMDTWLYSHS
jgi:hypothetical protein